jgi:hypothetical protein
MKKAAPLKRKGLEKKTSDKKWGTPKMQGAMEKDLQGNRYTPKMQGAKKWNRTKAMTWNEIVQRRRHETKSHEGDNIARRWWHEMKSHEGNAKYEINKGDGSNRANIAMKWIERSKHNASEWWHNNILLIFSFAYMFFLYNIPHVYEFL